MATFTGYATALNTTTTTTGSTGSALAVEGVFPGTACAVYNQGTSILATIYTSAAMLVTRPNPFLVNLNGSFTFYGAGATYDLVFSNPLVPAESATSSSTVTSAFEALGLVNVQDYGADPNDIEDSSPAFALAYLDAASGDYGYQRRSVWVPPGRYRLTTPLVMNTPYVDLFGSGLQSQLHWVGGAGDMITVASGNIKLSNFLYYGTDVTGEVGIHLSVNGNVKNLIERVQAQLIRTAIKVRMFDQTIRGCQIDSGSMNGRIGIDVGHNANAVTVDDCYLMTDLAPNNAIHILVSRNAKFRLLNSTVQYASGGGVVFNSSAGGVPETATLINNYMETLAVDDVDVDIVTGDHIVMENNRHNCSTANSTYAVRVAAAVTNPQFSRNKYYNFSAYAIQNLGASGIRMDGNTGTSATLISSLTGVVQDFYGVNTNSATAPWIALINQRGDFYPTAFTSAGIQAALDACAAANGDGIFLKYGTYVMSTPVTITQDFIVMEGGGRRSWLQWTGGGSTALTVSAASVTLRDFLIYGTDVASEIGILLSSSANVGNVIERVQCQALRTSIKVLMTDQTIRSCEIDQGTNNGRTGINVGLGAHRLTVDTCQILGGASANNAIGILVSGNSKFRLINSTLLANRGGNVIFNSSAGSAPTCATVYHNSFETGTTTDYDIDLVTGDHIVIEDNRHNCGTGPSAFAVNLAAAVTNPQFLNNKYESFGTNAIQNAGATGIRIYGNTVSSGTLMSSLTGVTEGFYGTAPIAIPLLSATPTAAEISDVLFALGLTHR